MTDWSKLTHAYGSAEDIPDLLAMATPDHYEEPDIWKALYSRLCHQGTVYSASFAALPELAKIAAQWAPDERTEPFLLAASILDPYGCDGHYEDLLRPFEYAISELKVSCDECLITVGLERVMYLLQMESRRIFDGDLLWGRGLCKWLRGDRNAYGKCPECRAKVFVLIGKFGFFVTDVQPFQDYMEFDFKNWSGWLNVQPRELLPGIKQNPIAPESGELPAIGPWIVERARAAKQDEVAGWVPYLFGSSACPSCEARFKILNALADSVSRMPDGV